MTTAVILSACFFTRGVICPALSPGLMFDMLCEAERAAKIINRERVIGMEEQVQRVIYVTVWPKVHLFVFFVFFLPISLIYSQIPLLILQNICK